MSEDNSDHESDFESAESDDDEIRPTSIKKPASSSLPPTYRSVDVVCHDDVTGRRSPSSAGDVSVTHEKTAGSAHGIKFIAESTVSQQNFSEQPSTSTSDQITVVHEDVHHEGDDSGGWDVGDVLDEVDSGRHDQLECRTTSAVQQLQIDVATSKSDHTTDVGQCEETKFTSLATTHITSEDKSSRTAAVDDNKKSTEVLDKLSDAAADGSDKGSLWGWSSWGASVLSTASSSVATFTSQFEQGLNTVLETVESSLGAPSPEELASHRVADVDGGGVTSDHVVDDQEESSAVINSDERKETDKNLIGSLVSGVSSSFTNVLDNKVISGGLDTLELIGRKTMDVLQDGDPGLKKKRALLKGDKPCLSEVLREAKENAVRSSSTNPDNLTKIQVHFGTIFDDHQGFVHLEALEMLSKQTEQKVQLALLNLSGAELSAVQSELKRIEDDCVLNIDDDDNDDDDVEAVETSDENIGFFAEKLAENFQKFSVPVNLDKLTKVKVDGQTWLNSCRDEQDKRSETSKDSEEIYDRAIIFLAEFTAKTIEILHKTSELILVSESHGDDVNSLAGFVNTCCAEISIQAARYSACLNTAADDSENPDSVTPLITNVYLEASNSNTYIQDAFRLVVPIFQLMFMNRTNE